MNNERLINPETGEEIFSWPTGKMHVSYSELVVWLDCMHKHKLIYIDNLDKGSITPHLSFGTGIHNANEHFLKTRQMDKNIALDVIKASWQENEKLFKEGPFPSWAPKGYGELDTWLKKADVILSDVPTFLETNFPGWTLHDAEFPLYENIQDTKLKFKGFIDAIIKINDKKGHKFLIIDWKTCGWGWNIKKQRDFNVQLQLMLYKIFFSKKHSIPMKDIKTCFVLLKKDAKAGKSVSTIPVSVGPKSEEKALTIIKRYTNAIQRKIFFKNRSACNMCQFYETEFCKQNI